MKHYGIQPFDSTSFEVVFLSPDILLVSGGCARHVEALIDQAEVRALDSISPPGSPAAPGSSVDRTSTGLRRPLERVIT